MSDKHLMVSTILNYMNLVLDMKRLFRQEYKYGWREPSYNFYVKSYMLFKNKNRLWVTWYNMNDEQKKIRFLKPKYENKILNKIYFMFHRQVLTDDALRMYNVLTQAIFPDFCKELEMDVDFSKASSAREAADIVICSLYQNFFSSVSIEKFLDMFGLRKALTKESVDYIMNYPFVYAGDDSGA